MHSLAAVQNAEHMERRSIRIGGTRFADVYLAKHTVRINRHDCVRACVKQQSGGGGNISRTKGMRACTRKCNARAPANHIVAQRTRARALCKRV